VTVETKEYTAEKHHPRPVSRQSGCSWKIGSAGLMLSACLVFTLAGCVSSSTRQATHSPTPSASGTGSSGNLLTRWLPGHRESTASLNRLHQRYGEWQEQLGNLTEARKSYEYVLGENPKSTDAIIGLARLDHLAGRDPQAEQGFLKAIRLHPNDPQTHEAAGEFYASQKRWAKAIAQLNSAMMAAPAEPRYRYQLAVALARSGDLGTAMPHFVQTVGEAEAHYNIGYVLFEQGNRAGAEQHFVKAIALRPDLTQAQTMLADLRRTGTTQPLASRSGKFRADPADLSRQGQPTPALPIRPASVAVPGMTVAPQRPLASGMVPRQTYHRVSSNSVPHFSADQTSAHRPPTDRDAALTPQMEQRRNQLREFSGGSR